MERKIGEIFEFGSEWYQCIPDTTNDNCNNCCFQKSCSYITGDCSSTTRSDGKSIAFKKLEKAGEPMEVARGLYFQRYRLAYSTAFYEGDTRLFFNAPTNTFVYIEIKQTKEDMEDLDKIKVRDYTKVEELNVMEEKKLSLKPFDIQKAREGKPVCTRDGRKARIICFDRVGDFPIVALTDDRDYKEEGVNLYDINGKGSNECFDLMMLPEKKEGWVNVYYDNDASSHRGCRCIYDTKERAVKEAGSNYITTVKIEWTE